MDFNQCIGFVNKIKALCGAESDAYKQFLTILQVRRASSSLEQCRQRYACRCALAERCGFAVGLLKER